MCLPGLEPQAMPCLLGIFTPESRLLGPLMLAPNMSVMTLHVRTLCMAGDLICLSDKESASLQADNWLGDYLLT
jgi:hypothetical protein